MELNAPISIFKRQRYTEGSALAPFRDDRNTPQAWKKNRVVSKQGGSSLDALQQVVSKLSRQRRPFRGGFVPQTFTYEAIQPFQFYGIAPNSAYAINNPGTGYKAGDVLTLVGGTLAPGSTATTFIVAIIGASPVAGIVTLISVMNAGSYTTPPAYPAAVSGGSGTGLTVTAVSASDAWRTCSMRQGAIGLRSRFFAMDLPIAGGYKFENVEGMSNVLMTVGNYQQIYSVQGDGQQSFDQPNGPETLNWGCPLMLGAVDTPTLICGVEETQGDFVNWPQIVLNAPDTTNAYQAAFWLEIVDSTTSKGAYVHPNLWGQMFTDESNDAFPISSVLVNNVNIIPVAIVATFGGVMYVENFLTGNLINLFDSYFNNTPFSFSNETGLAQGAKTCFRGDWVNDSLVGQYFYPGDIVTYGPGVGQPGSPLTRTTWIAVSYFVGTGTPDLDANLWYCLTY